MLCPYCKEEIKDGAKKCRFCGEFLEEKETAQQEKTTEKEVVVIKEEKPKKKIGCLGRLVIITIGLVFLGVLVDRDTQKRVNQKVVVRDVEQTATVDNSEKSCNDTLLAKVGTITDFIDCAVEVSKMSDFNTVVVSYSSCSTTFMQDYYNKTVNDYSDCNDAEKLSATKLDEYYTTYSNCLGNLKTDYTKDPQGAFSEITQCHATFVNSFNALIGG